MSMSSIILVGNLVKAPETFNFASGKSKTSIVLAVNGVRRTTDNEPPQADFYKVELWGKQAELAARYLTKGSQVTVNGRLCLQRWTDRNGQDRMTPVVSANQISLPPKRPSAMTSFDDKFVEAEDSMSMALQ